MNEAAAMTAGGVALLISLLVAVFCGGAAVFYAITRQRGARMALIGWGLCAVLIAALGWGAFAVDTSVRMEIFAGRILPVWLLGGVIGLLIGVIKRGGRR